MWELGNDDVFYYAFDPYFDGWQYTQGIAVPKSTGENATITKIYIAAAYDNNFGTAQTQTYGFTYNNWGQSTSISVGNIELATYEYEAKGGNLTKMTSGNENSASYFYDDLDRLTKTVYNDTGKYVENAHTADGALARLTYRNGDGNCLGWNRTEVRFFHSGDLSALSRKWPRLIWLL